MKAVPDQAGPKRDSLFGEPVLWSGHPKELTTPPLFQAGALLCGVASAIATASAVVVATALGASPGALLAFAAWMAMLAVALAYAPRWWRSELVYVLTDKHIVLRRGRFRRSIERSSVSFARIHWSEANAGIGDLELVRAVPTGALRRRLSITLSGLVAPDRVWAILRGVTPAAPAGDGHRLLAQRLDEGERVLWSAHPSAGWRSWMPTAWRGPGIVVLALTLGVSAVVTGMHAVHALRAVVRGGLEPSSVSFVALVLSLSLTLVLLLGGAIGMLYAAIVRPARLHKKTRYWITDRRVLIQEGNVELHLDRTRIVDTIDTPAEGNLRNVFLVLDGPRARAVAAAGAFGEAEGQGLQPVLRRIADVDAIRAILEPPPADEQPRRAA